MSDLIEKLRAAKGVSRELDGQIAFAVNPRRFEEVGLQLEKADAHTWKCFAGIFDIPAYTASLDAAMTLVPDECRWYVADSDEDGGDPVASVWRTEDMFTTGVIPRTEAAHPAIALCIAALRARATI